MKCQICGFDKGHFVCSQAPVYAEYKKLVKENRELKGCLAHILLLAESYLRKAPSDPDNALLEDARELLSRPPKESK